MWRHRRGWPRPERERTMSRIDRLHAEAREREDAGEWEAAPDGLRGRPADRPPTSSSPATAACGCGARAQAVQEMRDYLADPAALSEDAVFEQARTLLERARADAGAGGAYRDTVDEFAALLSRAGIPVELVLVSDNATEVTVYRVGRLGSFERRALQLRPGRYNTIVGSRAGCRDVRKEIVLDAGTAPVTIRCEERI